MIIHSTKLNICIRRALIAGAVMSTCASPLQAQYAQLHKNAETIRNIFTGHPLGGATAAIAVRSLATGQLSISANERLLLRPASIQKLLPTALALDSLGGGFRFRTEVRYSGTISDGALRGDIYLIGSGDPSLGTRYMDSAGTEWLFGQIEKMLASAGIRSVSGRIAAVPDAGAEHPVPDTWLWQDIGNYYGSGPSGLCFMDNTYLLQVQAPAIGGAVQVKKTSPAMPELAFTSYATAAPVTSDESYIYGAPFSAERELRGQLPANKTMQIKGAMPRPGLVCARELTSYLRAHGIAVSGAPALLPNIDIQTNAIGHIMSPPLREIVAATNKKSLNLYAEQLMLAATADADYAQRTGELLRWLQAAVPDASSCRFFDASGLSPFNLATADVFAQFLCAASSEDYFTDFAASLPVAGSEGTLKSWFRDKGIAGKIAAKTGSMTGTRSLAGYITARDGNRYAFCIMVNNYSVSNAEVKSFIENIMYMVYDN